MGRRSRATTYTGVPYAVDHLCDSVGALALWLGLILYGVAAASAGKFTVVGMLKK